MAVLGNTSVISLTLLDGVIGNLNPKTTNVYTLGTSSLKWNNVYATTFTGNLTGNATISAKDGFTYSGIGIASDNVARPIWFAYNGVNGRPVIDNDFKYNPANNTITIGTGSLSPTQYSGNAATATTASKLSNTSAVGAADRPVYFTNSGVPSQTTYRMAATNVSATGARAITDNLETGIWYVNGTNVTGLYSQSDGAAYVNKYSDSWIAEIYQDYRTGQIAIRGKNNGTWQAWRQVLDSSNYTDYTVTKTGTGASGTWGISISGNAATATKFASAQSVTLTGDVTGTASSTNGWSIATTLANSGATAGSYGDSGAQTPAYGATFKVPYVTVDAKGRVTSISEHTVKIPTSDNSDTKVTQSKVTTNSEYRLLLKNAVNDTNETSTANYGTTLTYNPSLGRMTATHIAGKSGEFRTIYGSTVDMWLGVGTGNENHGLYDDKADKWMIVSDTAGNVTVNGNATTATKFASAQSVTLTGDVTGTASSQAGWSIATTIGAGKVTNAMLAGSIANAKLANSSITVGSKTISLGGSATLAEIGAAAASHTHGSITNDGKLGTASRAVVTDANKNITVVDLSVSNPTDASSEAISFIDSISQNSQGKITPTRKSVRVATASASGVVSTAAQTFAGVKTFNDIVKLKANQYADTAGTGSLDLQNSDIYGVNSIKFADLADAAAEGLQWYRSSTAVDSFWVKNGVMYFTPNRTWGGTATNYTVLHSGNLSPTWQGWTDGTTAGPVGKMGFASDLSVTFDAIPVATTTKSGVVSTTTQSFAGAKTFGDITISGTSDQQKRTISSSSTLYLNSASNCSIIFQKNGTNKWSYNANGTVIGPSTDNDIELGTTTVRWKDVHSVAYNSSFKADTVRAWAKTGPYDAGWKRVCALTGYSGYGAGRVYINGSWSSEEPTLAIFDITFSQANYAHIKQIICAKKTTPDKVRLVYSGTGGKWYFDVHIPARTASSATGNRFVTFIGKLSVSEKDETTNYLADEPTTTTVERELVVSNDQPTITVDLASTTVGAFTGANMTTGISGALGIAHGGTGATSFTADSIIMSGSSTTAALTTRAVTNNTSNTAIAANTNIPTMNTIYYGLAVINNASQTRGVSIYAPTTGGTAGYPLIGAGTTTAPAWYGGTVFTGTAAASWKTDFNGTTDATSTTAAAVVMDGGLGVAKQLRTGGSVTLGTLDGNQHVINGSVRIESKNGSYNEGLRINRSSTGYANIYLGGTRNSTSGNQAGGWWIGTLSTPADASSTSTSTYFQISHNSTSTNMAIKGTWDSGWIINPRLTVGTATLSTTYTFYVNGTSYFNNNMIIEKATASTTKATGALVIKGTNAGLGVAGQVNAETFRVNEKVKLEYNATDDSLDFVWA